MIYALKEKMGLKLKKNDDDDENSKEKFFEDFV